MNLFFLLASIIFFIWTIRNILFWVSLWQIKEYRLDRILAHLKETGQGRKLFFSPLSLIKWIPFLLYIIVVFNNRLLLVSQLFITGIFIVQSFFVFKEVYFRLYKRPVLTPKAIIVIFLTLSVVILLYWVPLFEAFLWLVFLDRIVPFLAAFFVFVFYFPTKLYRDWEIEKAAKKMNLHKKMTVIGVTGSYGKSSTKEYISQILQRKFRVLKTKGTNNTPIGIANTILSGLKNHIEIFVVEMGAYKKGEIKEMCQMVNPKIGIITAVNEQHLSLFGNVQNTMKAKYELIESLPKTGLSLFNGNNENTVKLYEKTKNKKVLYECLDKIEEKGNDSHIFAYNIKTEKDSINFDVSFKDKMFHMESPLIGAHNIENILPGIYIADYLGMSLDEIKKSVASLTSLPKTMILLNSAKGATLIDDTFNSNPQAVLAALEYMKIYIGKKILVLQPMIELGKSGKDEHFRIGKEISKVCNYLFVTNKNFYKFLMDGIKEGNGKCVIESGSSSQIAEFINKRASKQDVVVFEGKEAAFTFNKVL
ncbi:MAG: UDP-N-acetylmuramoyl-tripeptide--D-alanyl-D-alanine ligase [Candidatus Levybacteria bacterium]|nr:UDP-N-acetylmuramoyl-tripeptide--D-alanyl-D-alanine ligase [Candidatus Levybacteria bacterium]